MISCILYQGVICNLLPLDEKELVDHSIGISPNKLISKIASDFQKPDGLTIVQPEKIENFLEELNIRVIPGIGKKTVKIWTAF